MSAVATAGAAAWVVPEILTAKPAGGSTLSGPESLNGESADDITFGSSTAPETNAATTTPSSLAFSGFNLQRDAEVGAALIAGGWALQHWASRTSTPEVERPGDLPDR
jgi:hypothetical protein